MTRTDERLRILHIILKVTETSAAYNEHCLPLADRRDITICAYFPSNIIPPEQISLFEGDGTLKGFFRVLNAALAADQYDIVHAHSPHVALLFLVGRLVSQAASDPATVVTIHDSYQNFKARNRLMLMPVFAAFRRVVCCSKASHDSFPTLFKMLAGKRLAFAQNGLDIDRVDGTIATAPAQPSSSSAFTVVAISRLLAIKNPFAVLAAFQKSRDEGEGADRLVYIGEGQLRQALVAESHRGVARDQIEFTGLVRRETVFKYLLNGDLFISASRGEGLPIAVLEAMACRCPVLLSDIPPHREIAEGVDFIPLVDPDDVDGFAREIERFRAMPASERREIGQRCRKLVEAHFSLSAMHARYNDIYARLTDKTVPSPLAALQ